MKRVGGRHLIVVAVAVLAAVAGFLVSRGTSDPAPAAHVDPAAGNAIFALALPDSHGELQALQQWRGRVLVVNFWATWCPPCLTEIPDFAAVSRGFADSPVQFVGLGIDKAESVRKFGAEHDVPYPLLIGTAQTLELTSALGNAVQALPYTIIFDRGGKIAHIKLGTLNRTELEGKIRALLGE